MLHKVYCATLFLLLSRVVFLVFVFQCLSVFLFLFFDFLFLCLVMGGTFEMVLVNVVSMLHNFFFGKLLIGI